MKIEMHAHTCEVSTCAVASAKELVEMYTLIGYDAVVLTNHLSPRIPGNAWEGKKKTFLDGYRLAVSAGEKRGLPILFGMEVNFFESPNDYLVYGITEEEMQGLPNILEWGIERFSSWARVHGVLVYQAHPCREYIQPIDLTLVDGLEVHNGNPRHNSHNDRALALAEQHKLLQVSGSDFHELGDEGRGGIETEQRVETLDDLMNVLRSGKYTLLH